MSNQVEQIAVAGASGNLFDTEYRYVIPLYQRAFAWEEKQLLQLIEDIEDVDDDSNYYLGSVIVSRQSSGYEVVDGQQRLTSLYLLMSCLGMKLKPVLSFACREKSNYTLSKIQEIIKGNRSCFDMEQMEPGLYQGIRILKERMENGTFNRDDFLKKLGRVILYRIEVPKNTDLNRYFEIMNTRGEQLEQHDILKATLMSYLSREEEKAAFAKIWEACSDMTGYVQMHFPVRYREWIFGGDWKGLPSARWKDYKNSEVLWMEEGDGCSITDIVKRDFRVSVDEMVSEEPGRVRFESVTEFPYFLLHVLKVFVRLHSVKSQNPEEELLKELLDDKKLLDSFERVIRNGVRKGRRIWDHRERFSGDFIVCLLRSRFLFDKYIIKREYANEDLDGEWSLKELRVSGQQTKKRPYYANTRFIRSGEWASTNDRRAKTNLMLQSALRVSYTSPKVMHWITALLHWLSKNNCENTKEEGITEYGTETEKIASRAVIDLFLEAGQKCGYRMGVNTPHIVFNYLDFLIWKSDPGKYADFVFEFRNSVEHWYPQNPSEGTFEPWSDGADRFGNLCILQRSINSKFSNMSPEAKKSTFDKMIRKGSLKLRIMSARTEKNGSQPASVYWKEEGCEMHEEEMIRILKEACGLE